MSAQEVKSEDTAFQDLPKLDGKTRIFRTVTTIENSKKSIQKFKK